MTLEAKQLTFFYEPGRTVFRDVSFRLEAGEIMTILGPNGSGKSTLLNCLVNIYTPKSGEVLLDERPIRSYPIKTLAKLVGYVPQNHALAYAYSVRDFVAMGRAPYLKPFRQPGREDYRIVDETLETLGLTSLAFRSYSNLSGGERQQASIARAIVQQPKLIILDEPANHLDYGNQLKTLSLIRNLADKGYGIILTSHNPDHIMMLDCSVGILSRDGSFRSGRAREVITEPELRALYNSRIHVTYVEAAGRTVCIPGGLQ